MLLQKLIPIPKILVAAILCKHYEIELRKEIVYYFNRYQKKIPEFKSINASKSTFGTLMSKISNTITAYDDFNKNLQREASITLKGSKPIVYDEKKEKHLPQQYQANLLKLVNVDNIFTI